MVYPEKDHNDSHKQLVHLGNPIDVNNLPDEVTNDSEQRGVTYHESASQTDNEITDGLSHSAVVNSQERDLPGSSNVVERIQVDAVHPIFNGYQSRKKSVGTSTEEDKRELCYCFPCKTYFNKNVTALEEHFSENDHKPLKDGCVYCGDPVYIYYVDSKEQFYHKCYKTKSFTPSTSSTEIDNDNNNNDSNEVNSKNLDQEK